MKRILASALICAAPLSILIAPPASAQWTVYDPANHIQNIYQAIRSLQEVNQQIQQLTHEIEMLENMARDLEALPDSIADDILRRMRRIEELMREAVAVDEAYIEAVNAFEVTDFGLDEEMSLEDSKKALSNPWWRSWRRPRACQPNGSSSTRQLFR